MEWISCKDALPTEEGQYLVTTKGFGRKFVELAYWANRLDQIDDCYFDEKAGFYGSDSEWGYYEVDGVLAWCKVEPYEGEDIDNEMYTKR